MEVVQDITLNYAKTELLKNPKGVEALLDRIDLLDKNTGIISYMNLLDKNKLLVIKLINYFN